MDPTHDPVVQKDISRNRLTVRYRGVMLAAEAKSISDEVLVLVPHMRPGFTFLADLSDLTSMELECAPFITRIMDACNAAGIGTVVRIIPDPRKDIGLNILSITHYSRRVHVITCQTAAEAERAL